MRSAFAFAERMEARKVSAMKKRMGSLLLTLALCAGILLPCSARAGAVDSSAISGFVSTAQNAVGSWPGDLGLSSSNWCGYFVGYCINHSGVSNDLGTISDVDCANALTLAKWVCATKDAGVFYSVSPAHANRVRQHAGLEGSSRVQDVSSLSLLPGDILVFSWNTNWDKHYFDHVGIVTDSNTYVDGNSSSGKGKVASHSISGVKSSIIGYIRFDTNECAVDTEAPVITSMTFSDISEEAVTVHCTVDEPVSKGYVLVFRHLGNREFELAKEYEIPVSGESFSHTIDLTDCGGAGEYGIHVYVWDDSGNQSEGRISEMIYAASEDEETESDFELENGVLTAYTGPGGDVVVPEGVGVIGNSAFSSCSHVKSVVLPDSVWIVEPYAFSGCSSMLRVSMGKNVTMLDRGAFYECRSLSDISIPATVSNIGDEAFAYCSGLRRVSIPQGVTVIKDMTFWGCTSMTEVTIPDSVTTIQAAAFQGCSALETVNIGENVTNIDPSAFEYCPALTIYGKAGSAAEAYAKEAGIPFVAQGGDPGDGLDNFQSHGSYNDPFTDVNYGDWFYENVRSAYLYGLMAGTGNGRFNVLGKVTVAEAVTVAARLHSIFYTGSENFVQSGDVWYQVYVDYAQNNGIMTHTYDDFTRPATRWEFAELLAHAFPADALPAINDISWGAIPDVDTSAPWAEAVYRLYRAGILTGVDSSGSFQPDASISRAEIAALVTRMAVPDLRKQVSF